MFPYKIIFTDLDLTLLRTGAILSDYSAEVLNRALEKGVKICFASGRKPGAIAPFMGNLRERVSIAAYNGALVRAADGRQIFSSYADGQAIGHILKKAKEAKLPGALMVYSGDCWFVEDVHNEYVLRERDYCRCIPLQADFSKLLNKALPINKVMFLSDYAAEMERILLPEADLSKLHICLSASICLDIMQCGVNKSVGMDKLLEHYGLKRSEAIAFGDSPNDIELLREAGWGVAMGNAGEKVKIHANDVALSNDLDGVAEYLRGLGI
ncbi:HAD family hydrolase [bacterium]|nr:HAD family hydrolase [bacterium]